jgi:hypothetical protein
MEEELRLGRRTVRHGSMLGEATLDVSGTFAGEAIRIFILFVAQH